MRITVLGAGNGGFGCAADLALRGHQVTLFEVPELGKNLEEVRSKGGLELYFMEEEQKHQFAKLSLATTNIAQALEEAELIVNPVPAFAHAVFAELAAPHLKKGQIVCTFGKGGGSLTYAKAISEAGNTKEIFLGETNTLPYGASKMGPALVRIESYVFELFVGSFPGKNLPVVVQALQAVYPMIKMCPAANVLECILVDYNAITHTGPMVSNAARIDSGYHKEEFHLFDKWANPPAVVRITEAVDRERIALSEVLGIKAYTLPEMQYRLRWNPKGKEDAILPYYEAIHTEKLEICEGPYTLKSRHLSEDVPLGLVTYSSLGKMLGVPTPVTDALIVMASTLNAEDYRGSGRTVEKLGINPKWSLDQLKKYLFEGKAD